MNIIHNSFNKLKKILKKIKLIDKCLIIFMIILMSQSIYNLFINESSSQNSSVIDAVVRTTSASIFGYFLSGHFVGRTKDKENCYKNQSLLDNSEEERLKEDSPIEIYKNENEIQEEITNQQIIIATTIGVISLVVLIIARNLNDINPVTLGTISQLRDFVSGCVGFLLGCSNQKNSDAK